MVKIFGAVTSEPQSIAAIAESTGYEYMTTAPALRCLYEAGKIQRQSVRADKAKRAIYHYSRKGI